jgi:F0F1-type ATP synthase membrane subunit b/b'
MAIFQQLGIDGTIVYQFVIFVFGILFLSLYVFVPYRDALLKREERTLGGEELAEELNKESQDLHTKFEAKAKEINSTIKKIYDDIHKESLAESEKIVASSKEAAQATIEETRKRVAIEVAEAGTLIKGEIPVVADAITKQLLK